ncbi:MAG: hypothetical protein M0042_08160 [Nitrospiraceae bacterium]|nr:hypothetical protein [Nitrospiraceae bacterium]
MKRFTIISGLLLALAAGIAAAAEEGWVEKRAVATVGSDGVQRMEITGGDFYFDPNVIVVKVNVPVELTVKKVRGIVPHDFTLKAPEAGIDVAVKLSSDPQVVKFTPTKTGSYAFECTKKPWFFKSHKDRGMHGTLEVVE